MTLDATMRPLATRLLLKFGKTIAYTHVTAGAYVPATGSAVPTTVADSIKAYVDTYKGQFFFSPLIKAGDLKLTVAGEDFSSIPMPGDTFICDSDTYTVLACLPTYSGELIALWEIAGNRI